MYYILKVLIITTGCTTACTDTCTLLPEHETNLHCLQVEIAQICIALNCNDGKGTPVAVISIKKLTQLIIRKTDLVVSLIKLTVLKK